MRPGRHSLSELHARPTQPEPGAKLTRVLGATDIPVTAGFWAASRSVRFRSDVTTSGRRAPTSPCRPRLRAPRLGARRLLPRLPGAAAVVGNPRVTRVTCVLGPLSGPGGRPCGSDRSSLLRW